MLSSTPRTYPVSLIQTCLTFRPSNASAFVAGLGGVTFVDSSTRTAVPSGFVFQHVLEATPSRVQHGLSHVGFGENRATYTANDNVAVRISNSARLDVQFVVAFIFYLAVNSIHAFFIIGALCYCQRIFLFTIEFVGLYFPPIGKCCKVLQTEIDTYRFIGSDREVFYLGLKSNIPPSVGFLNKAPGFEQFIEIAVTPETIPTFLECQAVAFQFNGAAYKRNPTERLTHISEFGARFVLVSGLCKLFADLRADVTVNVVFLSQLLSGFVQLEVTRPEVDTGPMELNAKVPDKIDLPLLLTKSFAVVFVLDPELVGKYAHVGQYTWSTGESQVELRKTRGSVFSLNVHLVFVTKYRRKVFDKAALGYMEQHCAEICEGLNCDLQEFGGEPDHVHLLVSMVPKVSVSMLVNALKGATSRMLRKERPELKDRFFGRDVLWSPSYFAMSVGGAPLEILKTYIQEQEGGFSSPA